MSGFQQLTTNHSPANEKIQYRPPSPDSPKIIKPPRSPHSPKNQKSEYDDPLYLTQQWNELMRQVQSIRQELVPLQKEAETLQIRADQQAQTPEVQQMTGRVQELKETKEELDDELQNTRKTFTPAIKSDIDNEVADLRREFFLEYESLEVIQDMISKKNVETKNFYENEPAKSILEAQRKTTDLSHRLNFLYKEGAEIDADFEETFNPSGLTTQKENRRVSYLKRKLAIAQKEVERRKDILREMKKEHESEKSKLIAKKEEEERKRKIRMEMMKSRRKEMFAQQRKAAGYDAEKEEKEKEKKKNSEKDNNKKDKNAQVQAPKDEAQAKPPRPLKRAPRKKSPQVNENRTKSPENKTDNKASRRPKRARNAKQSKKQNEGEEQIHFGDEADDDGVFNISPRRRDPTNPIEALNDHIQNNIIEIKTSGNRNKVTYGNEDEDENIHIGDEDIKIGDEDNIKIGDENNEQNEDSQIIQLTYTHQNDEVDVKPTNDFTIIPSRSASSVSISSYTSRKTQRSNKKEEVEQEEIEKNNDGKSPDNVKERTSEDDKEKRKNNKENENISNVISDKDNILIGEQEKDKKEQDEQPQDLGGTTSQITDDLKKELELQKQKEAKAKEEEERIKAEKAAKEAARKEALEKERERVNGLIGRIMYDTPDQSKSTFSSEYDSCILLDLPPTPLFEKLSQVLRAKGVASAGKFDRTPL